MLLSLHLKATMMKVSDPIMFGHAVAEYYADVFAKHGAAFADTRRRSEQRHRRRLREDSVSAGRPAGCDQGGHRRGLHDAAASRDGRLEQGDHQSARSERRDHRRVDAGGDPRVGPDVGPRRQALRHDGDDPGPLLRRASIKKRSTTARRTARSTWRRWAAWRTWASWRSRRRSTAPTTRRSRSRARARSASSTPAARRSPRTTSTPATSGACARRRTCRSATG